MKKIIIPIIFALAGTSFVAYSFLDTYIIPKEYTGVFNANNGASNFSFSFADMGGNHLLVHLVHPLVQVVVMFHHLGQKITLAQTNITRI